MNLLFVGDVVGPAATAYLVAALPGLRRAHAVDLVVANAENCARAGADGNEGVGMDLPSVERLVAAGVDVVTSGNHAWDHPDADRVLALPRVLRPHNLPPGRSGTGLCSLDVGGERVTVLNVADTQAIPDALPAYAAWREAAPPGTTIVDFHGGIPTEKAGFAWAVDGRVAAVLGTHTHEPTLPLHRWPNGTGFVVDVGMTGPTGGYGGFRPETYAARLPGTGAERLPFRLAEGPIVLGAVVLRIEGGRTESIVRLAGDA